MTGIRDLDKWYPLVSLAARIQHHWSSSIQHNCIITKMTKARKTSTDVKNPEIDQVVSQDIGRSHIVDHHAEYNGKYGFAGDEVAQAIQNYTPGTAVEKKMLRKVDLYQIPILWFMCVMAYVDRNNIVSDPCSL